MTFKWNLLFVTHFIEYQYFTLRVNPGNTGEKHIIHFMGLPVVIILFFKINFRTSYLRFSKYGRESNLPVPITCSS